MLTHHFLIALSFTLIAGLATGFGSIIGLLSQKDNKKFLSVSLGFSAGVMIYVSMIEIFPKANESLAIELGEKLGTIATTIAFFVGILIIALIDKLIPSDINPHELHGSHPSDKSKLMKMGLMTATALAIHNFPEGLATFVSALKDPNLAVPIVIAIAIHNIPEGLAVSVPIYQATGSRQKAFIYSFLSGLAEPIGALVGWFILLPFMSPTLYGLIFASVSGIMVFISLDELLPAAREFGEHHLSIYGLISGMATMAISLLLFM